MYTKGGALPPQQEMKMSNGLKAKVTVSRSSDDLIRIRFRDEASGIQFAEARMTLEEFALAVTGLAEREAELEVTGLQYVGKRRVTEQRSIVCPLDAYNKDKLEEWLKENAQEEGWLLNSYLGSQGSVSTRDGVTILRYSVTKYVDED